MGCGLRAALAPADRRALRAESESAAALLPVSGRDEAESRQYPRFVYRIAQGTRRRSARARAALCRGQLGVADAWRIGSRLGSLAQWHGGHAVHLFPAG